MDGQGKYAVLARGEAQLFTRLPRAGYRENIWDVAAGRLRGMHACAWAWACARAWACKMRACAGALLVEEAGGRVSDLEGLPLDFSRGAPPRPLPDRTHSLQSLRQCSPGRCAVGVAMHAQPATLYIPGAQLAENVRGVVATNGGAFHDEVLQALRDAPDDCE